MVGQAERPPVVDEQPRCWRCDKALAVFLTRPWRIDCPRCKATNKPDPLAEQKPIK
jgi:phage FluMu protein Com